MKQQEQHSYGKFNLYAALYYFSLLLIVLFALYLLFSKEKRADFWLGMQELSLKLGFQVNNLAVNSLDQINANELAEKIDVADKPILSLDLKAIRGAIETNSWVKEAVVERVLPNQIKITILEYKAKAIWQTGEKFYLVDAQGETIKEITKQELPEFADLIVLTGEGAVYHIEEVFQILGNTEKLMLKTKAAIYVGERRWDIMMNNNMIVKLPATNPQKAWQYFSQLNEELDLINNDVISIDLRIPELLFLELDPKNSRNKKLLEQVH